MYAQVAARAGNFWDHVTSTYTVDLSQFELPSCQTLAFSFIDPVYVWISRSNALHKQGIPLKWVPHALYHPVTRERMYGAGIEHGNLLLNAYRSLTTAGKVALFNVNWDGGQVGFGSRSCKPIHVQVTMTLTLT